MAGRHPRISGVLAVIIVLVAGVAAGWLVGGGGESSPQPAQAAADVEFTPAADLGSNDGFTPAADIESLVRIEGEGSFGGSGSNFVCDREQLIGFLAQRPDRQRAWARVLAVASTSDAVGKYVRGLRPATLLQPTRVTNHKFVNGRTVPSQAILAAGTAVLIDDNGAVRVRCRSGSPLLDPIVGDSQRCKSCPADYSLPKSVQVASAYYVHPAPPPTRNEPKAPPQPKEPVTIRVQRQLPPEYVVKRTGPDRVTKTVTQQQVRTVFRTRTQTRTVTVRRPTRTQTVTRTVTVTSPAPPPVTRTITVYEGSG